MVTLLNITLGLVPTLILAASVAAGAADDPKHFRIFLLVYGLWGLTLAGWNWLESHSLFWIVGWLLFGFLALTLAITMKTPRPKSRELP